MHTFHRVSAGQKQSGDTLFAKAAQDLICDLRQAAIDTRGALTRGVAVLFVLLLEVDQRIVQRGLHQENFRNVRST